MARRCAETVAELARKAKVHRATASRWVKQGAPRNPDGTFDVDQVVEWHREHLSRSMDRTNERPQVPNVPDPLREARAARERLKVELDELALRKLKGELIERDEVAGMLVARARTLKRALRSSGRRLARKLARMSEPREVQKVIEKEHDAILREAYGGDE